MLNENLLKGKVKSCGMTLEQLADFVGINPATMSKKVSGTREFKRNEIELIRRRLQMSKDELDEIFFC